MRRSTEFITEFNIGKGQICARAYFHSTPFTYRLNAWRPRQVCILKHFSLSNSQERITSWLISYHRRSRRTCPRSRAVHRIESMQSPFPQASWSTGQRGSSVCSNGRTFFSSAGTSGEGQTVYWVIPLGEENSIKWKEWNSWLFCAFDMILIAK